MYEIDFLPVESDAGPGSKSGDAITMRFSTGPGVQAVVVIDGGFSDTGNKIAEHVMQYYGTTHVDIMISTHPDTDHINGLAVAMETLTVGELLLHQPRLHERNVADFSNIEAVDNLLDTAKTRRVPITEPFTGLTRFNGQLRVLGPTTDYYEDLLAQHLLEVKTGVATARRTSSPLLAKSVSLLERALTYLPIETLTDEGDTGPRNNSSVITLIQVDGRRLLFTGDAGVPALEHAAEEYERNIGPFYSAPLDFFQAPHHGSRRNVGPTLLNRILGTQTAPFGAPTSFISSAKASPKHPSPRVVNALIRRGAKVFATEGRAICEPYGVTQRPNWGALIPLSPLEEPADE
jgi:beta-lactamase superfamily II metal-dependent hydrolase